MSFQSQSDELKRVEKRIKELSKEAKLRDIELDTVRKDCKDIQKKCKEYSDKLDDIKKEVVVAESKRDNALKATQDAISQGKVALFNANKVKDEATALMKDAREEKAVSEGFIKGAELALKEAQEKIKKIDDHEKDVLKNLKTQEYNLQTLKKEVSKDHDYAISKLEEVNKATDFYELMKRDAENKMADLKNEKARIKNDESELDKRLKTCIDTEQELKNKKKALDNYNTELNDKAKEQDENYLQLQAIRKRIDNDISKYNLKKEIDG